MHFSIPRRLCGACFLLGMVGVVLLVKDSPYRRTEVVKVKMRALARTLRIVWGNPGTRLGLWSHFTSQFSVTVFSLLWGFPFLVEGQGLSSRAASSMLIVLVGAVMVTGSVLARLTAKLPFYRSYIVLAVVGFNLLGQGLQNALDPRATRLPGAGR